MRLDEYTPNHPKLKELYQACLKEIPLSREVPRSKPKTPPTPFYPQSFDELYAAKKDLQAGKLYLPREPRLQEVYAALNADFKAFEQFSPDQFHPFTTNMREDLKQDPVLFRPNDFPYQLPEDVVHNVMWYRPSVSRWKRAKILSRILLLDDLEPGDFMLFRNSPHGKSVPEFPHDHIYSRWKPSGFGFLKPFPSIVEIHMALAGEPGYTLDRAFKHQR